MRNNNKIITILITTVFLATTIAYPYKQAHAFNLFKETWNLVRKTSRFVISVPDKATKWMGPVLGPAASFLITKNILKNPKIAKIFKASQKTSKIIENIEEVKTHVNQLKSAYKSEANKLRAQANELEKVRKNMARDLLEGKDFDEYKSNVADIQRVIEAHRNAADQLDKQANGLNTEKFVQMLGNKFIKNTVGDIRDIVLENVAADLLKTTDPTLIKKFVEGEGSFDSVLDFMIQRELYGMETDKTFDMDALKDRIKDQIKDKLDENKDFLKDNWKQELQTLIQKSYEAMKEGSKEVSKQGEKYEEKDKKQEITKEQNELIKEFEDILDETSEELKDQDFGDCPNGYRFKRMSGVGCVQINCNEADSASHYSYTGSCICGSAGSVDEDPDDPNAGCYFPRNYEPCPGCLYACVHADEECPLEGIPIN